jgi:transcriptional regulator with XRE-family HTH domain
MAKSQIAVLKDVLRESLRLHGLRYSDIARELDVTERTVTRWFSADYLDTPVIEQLCKLVGLSFFELCELAGKRVDSRLSCLTIQQEQFLTDDGLAHYLFTQLLKGWTPEELQREAEIPEADFVAGLIRLEKAGLVELLPGNKVKLRTRKDVQSQPDGPISRYTNRWLAATLEGADVTEAGSFWAVDALKLSSSSFEQLKRKFEGLKQEARDLSEADRRADDPSRKWYAVVMTARQLDLVPPHAQWSATMSIPRKSRARARIMA